jgi:hypothetical protein
VLEDKVDGVRLVVRVMRGQVKWGVEDAVLDLVISKGAERGKAEGVGGLSLVKGGIFADRCRVETDTAVGGRGVRRRRDDGRRGWGAEAILVLNFLLLYLGGASRGFRAWYDAINPGANTSFDGSHVLSLVGYPLHLTRYCSLRRWVR